MKESIVVLLGVLLCLNCLSKECPVDKKEKFVKSFLVEKNFNSFNMAYLELLEQIQDENRSYFNNSLESEKKYNDYFKQTLDTLDHEASIFYQLGKSAQDVKLTKTSKKDELYIDVSMNMIDLFRTQRGHYNIEGLEFFESEITCSNIEISLLVNTSSKVIVSSTYNAECDH